jgi:hypothetical protein
MNLRISLCGHGHEFSIGTISQEVWDYIQEEYDGDFDKYLDSLDNGDVPEDLMLADDRYSMCDCDDLYHEYNGWLNSCKIYIETEEGNELFSIEGDALEDAGVNVERYTESVDKSVHHLAVFSSVEKGTFRAGDFEIEGDFDPKKLTVYCTKVTFGDQEDYYMVDSFEYDGIEIECDFVGTDGKGMEIYMVEQENHEEAEN